MEPPRDRERRFRRGMWISDRPPSSKHKALVSGLEAGVCLLVAGACGAVVSQWTHHSGIGFFGGFLAAFVLLQKIERDSFDRGYEAGFTEREEDGDADPGE